MSDERVQFVRKPRTCKSVMLRRCLSCGTALILGGACTTSPKRTLVPDAEDDEDDVDAAEEVSRSGERSRFICFFSFDAAARSARRLFTKPCTNGGHDE